MGDNDLFAQYLILGRQAGSPILPVTLKVPLIVFQLDKNKTTIEEYYARGIARFPHLSKYEVPEGINWEKLVEERILPYADGVPDEYDKVDSVTNVECDDSPNKHLILECMLSDSKWDKPLGII